MFIKNFFNVIDYFIKLCDFGKLILRDSKLMILVFLCFYNIFLFIIKSILLNESTLLANLEKAKIF